MIDVKKMREEVKDHTLYCSVMAHLRGKLHMTKLNEGTLFELFNPYAWFKFEERVADEGRHMFHWTMEDQARLVKNIIEKYTMEEPLESTCETKELI